MTDPNPIACTLDESDLRQRLDEIASLGAESLIRHEKTEEGHVLRFRNDGDTHRRLTEIAAGEAECCPFLDLRVSERDDELVLAIDAPKEGRPVADELVRSFSGKR